MKRFGEKVNMVVDVVNMYSMEEKLFDEISNEVKHVIDMATFLGNVDGCC